MELAYIIIIFIFGLIIGSFLNVVGYRLPNNMSI
ncbi:MAG TPA: prepilin peptidase, partial [Bacilli bacterium]|nr:prepilin peptidase [Bacilli bacterium]